MPLNRPAEPLPSGPRGAVQARRWVVGVCAEIDRPDLSDNAELALSEVVTNAIVHTGTAIELAALLDEIEQDLQPGAAAPIEHPGGTTLRDLHELLLREVGGRERSSAVVPIFFSAAFIA